MSAKRHWGAKKVTLAPASSRGTSMPASPEEIARAEEEGILVMPGWGLSKVIEENGVARGIELQRCTSPWDDKGAFNPQYDACVKTVVEAENIMLATGQKVDLSYFGEKYEIQLYRGYLDVDEETALPSREANSARATPLSGSCHRRHRERPQGRLRHQPLSRVDAGLRKAAAGRCLSFDSEGVKVKEPLALHELDVEKRRIDVEDSSTATKEEALAEARRCLNCGCYNVHPSDVAPALIALGASVVTTVRTIPAEDFFEVRYRAAPFLGRRRDHHGNRGPVGRRPGRKAPFPNSPSASRSTSPSSTAPCSSARTHRASASMPSRRGRSARRRPRRSWPESL
jgi:hypothetical protein